ncbi:MAG: glutamate-semialdehyde--aminomutase [Gammaproteobacteria bacterium]|jgi:glutamate-1-semialdehyde 2,1-aminomutase|nr:glutamate-semialdehyde--aminomutase [Gammaproteobacteria bacterium]
MSLSQEYYTAAGKRMPGGVNSPVRAFGGVGGEPIFFEKAKGAYLTDVDGKRYLDYVCGWGPMILGHAHPAVVKAIQECAKEGLCFGTPHPLEIALADKIIDCMPNIEMIRMVNSGTEATLSVLRLARGYTKRQKILKFAGCYHGHHDALLVQAGSGALTFSTPTSSGISPAVIQDTLVAQYNNLDEVSDLFSRFGDTIAAVIVEPVAGNMGCVPPVPGFLHGLRKLCDRYESLLIFDEVITGFRIAKGGAQALYEIKPDLTTLGKIIGGGLPIGAFGGRKDIMEHLAPLGKVYQAGTLSGNPVTMAAGLATLNQLSEPDFYERLNTRTTYLVNKITELAKKAEIPLVINQAGSLFTLFFTTASTVQHLEDVHTSNLASFKCYFHAMLKQGIYLGPSAYECAFVSSSHGEEEIEYTLQAIDKTFSTFLSSIK